MAGVTGRIVRATAIAGTLDILAAIGLTLWFGRRTVDQMLGYVASGPFPAAPASGPGAVVLGLAVHFTLMAIMATAYIVVADRHPGIRERPLLWGLFFGVVTYVVMNWLVVPIRFTGAPAFPPNPLAFGTQFFCHTILVGIPIALAARR